MSSHLLNLNLWLISTKDLSISWTTKQAVNTHTHAGIGRLLRAYTLTANEKPLNSLIPQTDIAKRVCFPFWLFYTLHISSHKYNFSSFCASEHESVLSNSQESSESGLFWIIIRISKSLFVYKHFVRTKSSIAFPAHFLLSSYLWRFNFCRLEGKFSIFFV